MIVVILHAYKHDADRKCVQVYGGEESQSPSRGDIAMGTET
jgi:hypothetical protein